jgi:RimJ/RimL family protein N-acetyltransferase
MSTGRGSDDPRSTRAPRTSADVLERGVKRTVAPVSVLFTPRMVLRQWRASDLAPFAALNADAEVRRHFPGVLSQQESDELAARIQSVLAEAGWGLWAVEVPGRADFIGFAGLSKVAFTAHFTPAVDLAGRFDRRYWGQGYASEAARAVLDYGFERLGRDEIVAFCPARNERSIRVMHQVGMSRDPTDDFDHPGVVDPDLRRHVLYRLSRAAWSGRDKPHLSRSS